MNAGTLENSIIKVFSGGHVASAKPKSSLSLFSIIASRSLTLANEMAELNFCLLKSSFLKIGVEEYTSLQTADSSLLKSLKLLTSIISPLYIQVQFCEPDTKESFITLLSCDFSNFIWFSISFFATRSSSTTFSIRY